jgi:hypothetical protein
MFAGFAEKPWFHECTWRRSANPPCVNARMRFSVEARHVVAAHQARRVGLARLGREVVAVHDVAAVRGSVTPPRVSVSLDRGFANCPPCGPSSRPGIDAP